MADTRALEGAFLRPGGAISPGVRAAMNAPAPGATADVLGPALDAVVHGGIVAEPGRQSVDFVVRSLGRATQAQTIVSLRSFGGVAGRPVDLPGAPVPLAGTVLFGGFPIGPFFDLDPALKRRIDRLPESLQSNIKEISDRRKARKGPLRQTEIDAWLEKKMAEINKLFDYDLKHRNPKLFSSLPDKKNFFDNLGQVIIMHQVASIMYKADIDGKIDECAADVVLMMYDFEKCNLSIEQFIIRVNELSTTYGSL